MCILYVNSIEGKTVTPTIKHVLAPPPKLPQQIVRHYWNIILYIDVMFVWGVEFLLTILHHLDLVTKEFIPDCKYTTYIKTIEALWTTYTYQFFGTDWHIRYAIFKQPEQSQDHCTESELHVSGKDKHIKDAERKIHTIKEGAWFIRSTISFFKQKFTDAPNHPNWNSYILVQLNTIQIHQPFP